MTVDERAQVLREAHHREKQREDARRQQLQEYNCSLETNTHTLKSRIAINKAMKAKEQAVSNSNRDSSAATGFELL